jgi:hypothetical protein
VNTYPSIPVVKVVTSAEGFSLGQCTAAEASKGDAAWLKLKQRDPYLETVYSYKLLLDRGEDEQ